MWTIFKVFIEFVTILLLFYVWVFWPWGMWDLISLTRDWIWTPALEGEFWTTEPQGNPLNFYFILEYSWFTFDAVFQQSDPVIYIHISILFQILFPFRFFPASGLWSWPRTGLNLLLSTTGGFHGQNLGSEAGSINAQYKDAHVCHSGFRKIKVFIQQRWSSTAFSQKL